MKSKSRRLGAHQLARPLVLALTLSAFVFCLLLPTGKAAKSAALGTNGKIAFWNGSGIFVMNPDGTGQTNLSNGSSPTWSPDGSQIAFAAPAQYWDIFTINADGSNRRQLTFYGNPEGSAFDPAWSPGGKKIAFLISGHIYIDISFMSADGGYLSS